MNTYFRFFFVKNLEFIKILPNFAKDSVGPQGQEGQDILEKGRLRTLSSRYRSRKSKHQKIRNGAFALGVLYPVHLINPNYKVDERI